MIRKLLCALGIHGPDWFGPEWGRCDGPFVPQSPHSVKRRNGREVTIYRRGEPWRALGDWKTRAQCIEDGERHV